jgi:hypothetical protein
LTSPGQSPQLNSMPHEPRFVLSEDDRRGELPQRGSPGRCSR